MWPHLISVSSSVKWGQYFLCSLLWGLEIISIMVQHSAWCTDLIPQEQRKAVCMCINDGAGWDGSFTRGVNRALGTQQEEREIQDGFMGECVWAEPGKMGRILTGCERRGSFKWKTNKQTNKKLWKKRDSDPLFESEVQHSSTRASRLALINHYCSLLHGVCCCSVDTFELWCWRRLLRVPWTVARRSKQSIRKEINPKYSLEVLMLKLKPQYFGHLMWRADSLEKAPDAGRNWGEEEKGLTEDEMVGWHHELNGHEFEQTPGDSEGGGLVCCSPWNCRVRHYRATE